jgi:hypothetical protein
MSQTQVAQTTAPAKERTYKIRMKPGCGKMLIGRKWELLDGSTVDSVPAKAEDRLNPVDVWLEARELDANGDPKDGPVAEVPERMIKRFLNPQGKPLRVVDGYQIRKSTGEEAKDPTGKVVASRVSYSPAFEPGAFDDSTFEIVRD